MQFIGFLFLVCLALEIASIVLMVKLVGGLMVLVLIILSFMLGSYLMRGNQNLSKILMGGELLRSASTGRLSFYQMLWPIRIPFAGILLMFPGFFSSLIGIILLIPFKFSGNQNNPNHQNNSNYQNTEQTHFYYQNFQNHHFKNNQNNYNNQDDIIEGEFVVKNPDNNLDNKN